jgi:putative transposase
MRSKDVAFLLADLGVTKTHSRPYTSNDNPYSESQFKTMKYCPEFPDRFGCIEDSRGFGQVFSPWYNDVHRHSCIHVMTPAMVHYDQAPLIRQQRQAVMDLRGSPRTLRETSAGYRRASKEVWINKPNSS